jgi:ELWxxDGT repeat protein
VTAGGRVFFAAFDSDGWSLWITDGTSTGTVRVAGVDPIHMAGVGSQVYFSTYEGADARYALWRSDGTAGGTVKLKHGFALAPDGFTAAGASVFFRGADEPHGEELWRTDGTAGGTAMVKDLVPGPDSSGLSSLREVQGTLFFSALNGGLRQQMYRSDGTAAGTVVIRALSGGVFAGGGAVLGGILYFSGQDGTQPPDLWRTDCTFDGTYRVRGLDGGSTIPAYFSTYGALAYFTVPSSNWTLWRTDGTAQGTVPVSGGAPLYPTGLGGILGRFYFKGLDPLAFRDMIWVTDGTSQGTQAVVTLPNGSTVWWSRVTAQGLFYTAYNRDTNRYDLWFLASESPEADTDGDGIPNAVEVQEGLLASQKDNDVFNNARLFVMQQYRDFLGREGDASGVAYYQSRIANGSMLRPQVVEAFFGSPEFQSGLPQVTRLYFSFFNRIPDFAGLMFQVGRYRAGDPLHVIAQNFSGSPEFTNAYGALTNEQYVDLVYQNVLGRPADSAGRQYYLERLNDGRLTRGQVMVGFSESPEFQQLVGDEVYVIAVYVGMLRRVPEASGLAFYVQQMENGLARNAIIWGFIGASEYHARFLP